MDEQQIQQIVDRVVAAIEGLKPGPAQDWQVWGAFGSYATLLAAVVAFLIGWWSIRQKREADARSEWWRRTQWALEASASDNDEMYSYGTGMLDLLARSELLPRKTKNSWMPCGKSPTLRCRTIALSNSSTRLPSSTALMRKRRLLFGVSIT